jgi:hypothetical protein
MLTASFAVGGVATTPKADDPPIAAFPVSWQRFAGVLKSGIERRFSADDKLAQRFLRILVDCKAAGTLPKSIILSTWVSERRISRITVDDGDPSHLSQDIRRLLEGWEIGAAPSDMPQPVRMRFVLQPDQIAAPLR